MVRPCLNKQQQGKPQTGFSKQKFRWSPIFFFYFPTNRLCFGLGILRSLPGCWLWIVSIKKKTTLNLFSVLCMSGDLLFVGFEKSGWGRFSLSTRPGFQHHLMKDSLACTWLSVWVCHWSICSSLLMYVSGPLQNGLHNLDYCIAAIATLPVSIP